MKFDLEWLQDHIVDTVDADTLSEALTHCGFLVETRDAAGSSEIWDIEVTTNRPDAMNHHGLAREAAVAVDGRLKPLSVDIDESDVSAHELAAVEIKNPELCTRYCARVIRGARLVASPDWLRQRLENCGVRSINAVVDATNYVLLNTGQPLHAFDLGRVANRTIVVRAAEAGETVKTLDGEERKLQSGDPIIADLHGPIALAGIMGGADSEIGDDTVDVLLESAHFEALPVRRTARRLGMHTEASHRFERGADPEMAPKAADIAAQLIAELTGGSVCKGRIDVYPRPWKASSVSFEPAALRRFAGLDIAVEEMVRILKGLEFGLASEGEAIICTAPSFRVDIERSADLYEEVIRHVGYAAVPSSLPPMAAPPGHRHPNWELVDRARRSAVRCGLVEAVTYAFIDSEADSRFGAWPLCPGKPVHLGNPLSQTQGTMRRSLLPGILAAARDTMNQGERAISLFEEGRVFGGVGDGKFIETERLVVALSGRALSDEQDVGFLELKGVVEFLLRDTGLPTVEWQRGGAPWLDDREGAVIVQGDGTTVGVVGKLSDAEGNRWGIKTPVYVAELDLQAAAAEPSLPRFEALPRFPSIVADITVEHGSQLAYSELKNAAEELADDLVEEVRLAARYVGKELRGDAVRSTLRIVYRHPDRSLTQDEVNALQEKLRLALAERLPVNLT